MSTYPQATDDQFTDSRFHTAKDKRLTVNATVRFLKSGLDPAKFTKRAYYFFHQTLSMSAEYDQNGFAWRHFQDEGSKARFLNEVRHRAQQYAHLDTERNADMAILFVNESRRDRETGQWQEGGVYADLLDPEVVLSL